MRLLGWWRRRRPPERWCACKARLPWIVYDANGYKVWCPSCGGRLR